jgi:hypothetical protein
VHRARDHNPDESGMASAVIPCHDIFIKS